jgi:hypothetical protein
MDTPTYKLVVHIPFFNYARGDEIIAAQEMEYILRTHEHFVTKVAVTEAASPAPDRPPS